MTLSDDLNATADEIERRGWTQGIAENDAGQVCILGGIRAAGFKDNKEDTIRAAFCNFLDIKRVFGMDAIPNWNDHPMRTQDEVIQALRDCAIKNQPDSMWG